MSVGDNVALRPDGPQGAPRRADRPGRRTPCGWSGSRATNGASPAQLSGGQRQRVALARALVNRPRVLLLDEPLGALDLKLREEMQIELKAIQQQVGITFIYVTHDQEEALTMSDRLAVFNAGRIEQLGVASGGLRAPGDAVRGGLRRDIEPADRRRRARRCSGATGRSPSGPRRSGWPPADADPGPDEIVGAAGPSASVVYLGPDTRYIVELEAGGRLVVTEQNLTTTSTEVLEQQGKAVRLIWKRQHELPVADGEAEPRRRRRNAHERTAGGSWRSRPSRCSPIGGRVAAAACRDTARPAPQASLGAGEGELNLIIWAGLRRARRGRPGLRLGHAVRDGDRLQGQHDRHDRLDQRRVAACSPATTTADRSRATPRSA